MSYHELSIEERVTIQLGLEQGFSQRKIARLINRAPSTISRELRRNREDGSRYGVQTAQQRMQVRRRRCRPPRKLLPGSERFDLVVLMLRERLSPEQISGKLRHMNIPSLKEAYICRETIYSAIYALPVGELRKADHLLAPGQNRPSATFRWRGPTWADPRDAQYSRTPARG